MNSCELHHGDCLDVMRTMPDNSVHSIVCDPPYGLSSQPDIAEVMRHWLAGDDYKHTGGGFMGKTWDSFVPGPVYWRECFRVLKPGGHLLAFAGSRTQDLMGIAIRFAGFELRDSLMWIFGSGFPKSLAVDKAIDKMDAAEAQQSRRYRFTTWVRSTGVTSAQIDGATGTNMGGHYTTAASQPAIMTREHLEACRHLLGDVPEWVEREADIRSVESKNFAEREVVGLQKNAMSGWNMDGTTKFADRDITAPATEAAKEWDGWGSALKPAYEPCLMARKPLDGTLAHNTLKHGCGGINVDASRVGANGEQLQSSTTTVPKYGKHEDGRGSNCLLPSKTISKPSEQNPSGRWPANLITDGSEAVVGLFPVTTSGAMNGTYKNTLMAGKPGQRDGKAIHLKQQASTGSAARFFYTAKCSKSDRNEGLDGFEAKRSGAMAGNLVDGQRLGGDGKPISTPVNQNTHPTLKPTALMLHLVKLVTPPNGTVLDPFAGSGSCGKAAMLMEAGCRYIGIEREAEYVEIAKARLKHAQENADELRAKYDPNWKPIDAQRDMFQEGLI